MIKATTEFDPCRNVPRRRVKYQSKQKRFRMVAEFSIGFHGSLNKKLWVALKPPRGWRKNPRQAWFDAARIPVRLQCYDAALALTTEQLEFLQAQISLMVN